MKKEISRTEAFDLIRQMGRPYLATARTIMQDYTVRGSDSKSRIKYFKNANSLSSTYIAHINKKRIRDRLSKRRQRARQRGELPIEKISIPKTKTTDKSYVYEIISSNMPDKAKLALIERIYE